MFFIYMDDEYILDGGYIEVQGKSNGMDEGRVPQSAFNFKNVSQERGTS